jgi:hypothetical protein
MSADLHFTNHGSHWLMEPRTDAGKGWIAQCVPTEAPRWGDGVSVPSEILEYVVMGATGDGLVCENLRPN